jgi:hypothetical protein
MSGGRNMLRTWPSFRLFDYFRVPCERVDPAESPARGPSRDACGFVEATNTGRVLLWVPADRRADGRISGAFTLASIPLFGSLLPDESAKAWLDSFGGEWHRSTAVCNVSGTWIASIWTDSDGNVFLPFDPNEAIEVFWSERYSSFVGSKLKRGARGAARRGYYRVRPAVPRPLQILVRRAFSRVQRRTAFPRWPVETALHDLYGLLFGLVRDLSDEAVPMISPWPSGYDWAFVLTHDVETTAGYDNIDLLCDVEIGSSYRSSWNFVPRNHHVLQDDVLERLRRNGFEIGVHGLCHDGRDIAELDKRLPSIREYAEKWNAAGFRSPATLRDWEAMPSLGFDYDSTYFDTSPYEPQPGGCCSWLPYMIGDMVELPITLPQDHTLFEILGGLDEHLWLDKARFIRERGGMALALTHPDYARNERLVRAYSHLLDEFAEDTTAWKALPSEVSAWWRMRAESRLARENGGWRIVGPASERGHVQFAEGAASLPR